MALCGLCFEVAGKDMWTASERVEELWFEVEDLLEEVQTAENDADSPRVEENLLAIVQLLDQIEAELTV